MNCDRVFDILTRGPFPSGASSDERVERHLSNCPACRRLASALQPAIELFEEAITPDEGRDLPTYWGELFVAEQDDSSGRFGSSSSWRGGTATRLATKWRRATGLDLATVRRTLPTAWRLSAAVLLGVCIGGLLRSADLGGHGALAPTMGMDGDPVSARAAGTLQPTLADVVPSRVSPADLRLVACLQWNRLTQDAQTRSDAESPFLLWADGTACCTNCHNADDAQLQITRDATAQMVSTCKVCHPD